jgi:hypothetical protein
VASAAELRFRLCRPATEIVSVVVAVVGMGTEGRGWYTQRPEGPCFKPYALHSQKTSLLNRDFKVPNDQTKHPKRPTKRGSYCSKWHF